MVTRKPGKEVDGLLRMDTECENTIFVIYVNVDQCSPSEEEKLNNQVDRMIHSVDHLFHCLLWCLIIGFMNKVIMVLGINYTWLNSMRFLLPVMMWLMYCLVCNISATELNT